MEIRTAVPGDLPSIIQIELECFPESEAASPTSLSARVASYPDHFWVLLDDSTMVGFVNGLVTEEPDLRDEMYEDAALHDEHGAWQMIFGVDIIPAYRRQGCAGQLLRHVIETAKAQGRRGVVLTCKEALVHYYAKFGFADEGISQSTHGGVIWHQMRVTF